jgi:hypothetical protein
MMGVEEARRSAAKMTVSITLPCTLRASAKVMLETLFETCQRLVNESALQMTRSEAGFTR